MVLNGIGSFHCIIIPSFKDGPAGLTLDKGLRQKEKFRFKQQIWHVPNLVSSIIPPFFDNLKITRCFIVIIRNITS
jgi:hypothetical protein